MLQRKHFKSLQKGSEARRVIFQEIIFPLIRPFTRDIIAISELLVGLLGFILSVVLFTLGSNAVYNILHLVLAIISTILGFMDMIVSLKFSQYSHLYSVDPAESNGKLSWPMTFVVTLRLLNQFEEGSNIEKMRHCFFACFVQVSTVLHHVQGVYSTGNAAQEYPVSKE